MLMLNKTFPCLLAVHVESCMLFTYVTQTASTYLDIGTGTATIVPKVEPVSVYRDTYDWAT